MAHARPDWTGRNVGQNVFGETIQSESGAPIWFFDNMDSAAVLWSVTNGTILNKVAVPGSSYEQYIDEGESALQVRTDSNNAVSIYKRLQKPVGDILIGFEITFAIVTASDYADSSIAVMPIEVYNSDGTTSYNIAISYNPTDYKWYVYNAATGTYTNFATKEIQESAPCNVRLVVNMETGYFDRCIINGVEYDLSSYLMNTTTTPGFTYFQVGSSFLPLAGSVAVTYVSNYKVTVGEI